MKFAKMKKNRKRDFHLPKKYLSTHVLIKYKKANSLFASTDTDALWGANDLSEICLAGIIKEVKTIQDRRGDRMAIAILDDFKNDVPTVIFAEVFERFQPIIFDENPVLVTGRLTFDKGGPKVIAFKIENLLEKYDQVKKAECKDRVASEIITTSQDILHYITEDPDLLFDISPHSFEDVVAEILGGLGFEIAKTPRTRDGGIDIRIARKDEVGNLLYLVECKRFSPNNKVSVSIVRQLYGVVQLENATGGMLVTTSSFTKDALIFQRKACHRLSLIDYFGIREWLKFIEERHHA